VQRTYDPVHKIMNTPKTGKTRKVDLSRELRRVLLDLYESHLDAAILNGRTDTARVIFTGTGGEPLSPRWLYKVHQRACRLAGLRAVRLHDLRHAFATIHLYEHHAPIQYVSEQLGHSSIQTTVNTYGHPRPGTNTAMADKLDGAVHQSAPYPHPSGLDFMDNRDKSMS